MHTIYPEEKWFLLYMGILYILSAAGCFFPEGTLLNIWIFYYYRTVLFFLPIISGMLFGYTLKKNRGISFKRILIWGVLAFLLYSVLCWLPLFSLHNLFLPTVFWRFRWCITEGPALLLAISFLLTALLTGRKEKLSSSKAPFPFLRALLPFGIYEIVESILLCLGFCWQYPLAIFMDPKPSPDWRLLWNLFIFYPFLVVYPILGAIGIGRHTRKKYKPSFMEGLFISFISGISVFLITTIPFIPSYHGYYKLSLIPTPGEGFIYSVALIPALIFALLVYFLSTPLLSKKGDSKP